MTPRPASAALTPLDEALRLLLDAAAPVTPRRVAPSEAIGRVMAEDVFASAGAPARSVALRDGWAVDSAAITGALPYAPVTLLQPPAWVEAGEALPEGADAVLTAEAMEAGDVVADAPAGDGARAAGDEIARGDRLAAAGERLSGLQALALGACGVAEVAVRSPRIRLVATGGDAAPVSIAVAAWCAGAGATIVETVAAPDAVEAIAHAIAKDGADAVFVIGGTGFGRADHSAAALASAGALAAHGLALRPGETTGFGKRAGRPVLLLPGRPEAALAAFLALGRPLIAKLGGAALPPVIQATLVRKLASTVGLSEIAFVRRAPGGVEPLGGADLPLRRLILADGAILAPPEREGYPEGAMVEIIPL